MTKYKMIFYVDGDNNVGQALRGLSDLTPEDEVHVFYGSKNKHYTVSVKPCAPMQTSKNMRECS